LNFEGESPPHPAATGYGPKKAIDLAGATDQTAESALREFLRHSPSPKLAML